MDLGRLSELFVAAATGAAFGAYAMHAYMQSGDEDVARVIVVDLETETILKLQRSPDSRHHPKQWSGPGGRINKDEDPAHGAARELYEESGLTGLPPECFVLASTETAKNGRTYYYYVVAVSGQFKPYLSFPRPGKEEHTDYEWTAPGEWPGKPHKQFKKTLEALGRKRIMEFAQRSRTIAQKMGYELTVERPHFEL